MVNRFGISQIDSFALAYAAENGSGNQSNKSTGAVSYFDSG